MNKKQTYIIIKHYEAPNGEVLPIVLLDSLGEVLEFDTQEKAEQQRKLFEVNSDSGYKYTLKVI